MIVVLRFHDGDRSLGIQIEHIVRFLRLVTNGQIAFQVNAAVRDLCLHGDVVFIPAGGDGRRDVMQLDVLFSHLLLIQNRHSLSPHS